VWSAHVSVMTVCPAKTDEPTEKPFGLWTRGAQGTVRIRRGRGNYAKYCKQRVNIVSARLPVSEHSL